MIPTKSFAFEYQRSDNNKNTQADNLLYDFELDKREWTSIFDIPYSIGRNLKTVFKKSNTPTDKNNSEKWQATKP